MARKLKLVPANPPGIPSPPCHLDASGLALWRAIMLEYAVDDAGGLELLRQACLAADMAERCRGEIDKDGPVLRLESGVIKDHPALRHELGYRAFVTRCIGRLGLDVEQARPAGARHGGGYEG